MSIVPLLDKDRMPVDGQTYTAFPVSGQLHVLSVGTRGQYEIGVLATVREFGDRLWFVVVPDQASAPDSVAYPPMDVVFRAAAYFTHDHTLVAGELHGDARFVALRPPFETRELR
ncbi:MAG TPA: hypothetical protein VLF67_00615 [Candidatus Saccharimonas sp.]|nr:hypothetical protein [Candidatus Saccharimonas sp.]